MPLRFTPDENSAVHPFSLDISSSVFDIERVLITDDFKLFGIIFVEECNRDSHNAVAFSVWE